MKSKFDVDRILEIEKERATMWVAFPRAVSETLGEESKSGTLRTYLNRCRRHSLWLSLQAAANDIIRRDLANFLEIIADKRVSTSTRMYGAHAWCPCRTNNFWPKLQLGILK